MKKFAELWFKPITFAKHLGSPFDILLLLLAVGLVSQFVGVFGMFLLCMYAL